MSIHEQLARSYENGFIDCNLKSLERYNPKLLINDSKRETKVLSSIQSELAHCTEFYFSVAFITESGIQSLLNTLDEIAFKGIHGKIITSQYQNFTEPKALRRLLTYKNIQLKIVTQENFHAKGYIFKQENSFSFIIGSSNLTQNALSYNKEWNLKLSSLEHGSVMQNILREFDSTFDYATIVTEAWIEVYEQIYNGMRKARKEYGELEVVNKIFPVTVVSPNKMQMDALRQLDGIRKEGKRKAIIISATGTGKTYLSAFDVAKVQPKRLLFIVHRENILRAAMRSFKKVLGQEIHAGILSGSDKNFDCDYTFATIQTITREGTMNKFAPDYFDYVVIDEVHRAGADTYQKILDYYRPDFLLGMTATPERMDGYDIFRIFDYNIAYEIRLNQALEENMLTPFHYFGISEIVVDGKVLTEDSDFNNLVCDQRIDKIVEAMEHYSYYGDRVKGLIFCRRVDEAEEISVKLNQRGFFTKALSGKNNEEERERDIQKLEQDSRKGGLDYILTVDIFNEGVDIPMVNQIIMLRPTQSAIVFVQQLGRGLRKSDGKEYLTVIDFIGNYGNNFLVPIALYGDRSYSKDTLRKLMNSRSSMISGCSTVNFDRISKERIYQAIDLAKLSTLKDLKKDYQLMSYRLGRVPMMTDFLEQGGREPYSFVEYQKTSYYDFVKRIDFENHPEMDEESKKWLAFYSKEILNGKRLEEIVLLGLLKGKRRIESLEFSGMMKKRMGQVPTEKRLHSVIRHLNGEFLKDEEKKKYGMIANVSIVHSKDISGPCIQMDAAFWEKINAEPLTIYLDDMIRYAFKRFMEGYSSDRFREGFQLYEKYSRKDVCRILDWEKNEESTMYGYRIKHHSCPIFVTYHKRQDVIGSQNYEDAFINSTCFSWMTRSRVRMDSAEVVSIQNANQTKLRIPLFIKKSDGEGKDFYYMGDVIPADCRETTIRDDKGKELPIVNIIFEMKDEVEDCYYNYFENSQ